MIDNYKIVTKDGTEVLYLYMNYDYEFSIFNNKGKNLISNIKEYIKHNNIKFNGNKIKIIMGGIALCTFMLTTPDIYALNKYQNNISQNNYVSRKIFENSYNEYNPYFNMNIEEYNDTKNQNETEENMEQNNNISKHNVINQNNSTSSNEKKIFVSVLRSNGKYEKVEIDDYIIGVLASEVPITFNTEALKAQAIVIRTYTLNQIKNGKSLTDNTDTQVYKNKKELKEIWGKNYNTYYNKLKKCVDDTKNKVITYNNDLIEAVYHSISAGKTESAYNVWGNDFPYLRSVESNFDINVSNYKQEVTLSYEKINTILGTNISNKTNIIIYTNESGYVDTVYFDGISIKGINIRKMFNLRSNNFEIYKTDIGLKFITKGYGHGVGMSQYGANYLANCGYNYEYIINYYYRGVNISNL